MSVATDASAVRDLLAAASQRRAGLGLPADGTDTYRLFHGEGDGEDGVFVDVYGRWLVAELYADEPSDWENTWLDALAELPFEGVYLKRRPRQANVVKADQRQQRAPATAVRGQSAPDGLVVHEAQVPFEVVLGDGLATGLYLDQRENRARVRQASDQARVLNLFAYTCSFGVVARLGGATETFNADVARGALARGKRNYALSSLELAGQRFWARDVRDVLQTQARQGHQFDLIVLDPPSFAKVGRRTMRVERDFVSFVTQCAQLLSPGGRLLACCNRRGLGYRDFEGQVHAGLRASGRAGDVTILPPPADFPAAPGAPAHLKSAWLQL